MPRRSYLLALAALTLAGCRAPTAGSGLPPGASFALDLAAQDPTTAVSTGAEPDRDIGVPATTPTGPAPAVPTPVASAPASSGGGGSGGNGGGPPGPQVTGQVLAFSPTDERPLAGARIATSDGRTATSGPDGSFALAGLPPADGVYVASRVGYATLVLVGVPEDSVRLALQPRGGIAASVAAGVTFTVHGQLLGPAGQPVVDAFVALGDAQGTTSVPAISGVDGKFDLLVTAADGAVAAGTLLAAARNGAFLGLASGVAVSADQPDLAPLAMVAADHPVDVALDTGAMGAIAVPQAIDVTAADGTRLGISLQPGSARVAQLPGVHYSYRAEAVDPAQATTSTAVLADLPIDFASPATHLSATLLAPPDLAVPATLVPDLAIAWPAVPGADGYHLSLTGTDVPGFAWEGFTADTGLKLALPDPPPAGHYDLVLAALDGASRMPRALQALISGPPSYRKATRRVNVSL